MGFWVGLPPRRPRQGSWAGFVVRVLARRSAGSYADLPGLFSRVRGHRPCSRPHWYARWPSLQRRPAAVAADAAAPTARQRARRPRDAGAAAAQGSRGWRTDVGRRGLGQAASVGGLAVPPNWGWAAQRSSGGADGGGSAGDAGFCGSAVGCWRRIRFPVHVPWVRGEPQWRRALAPSRALLLPSTGRDSRWWRARRPPDTRLSSRQSPGQSRNIRRCPPDSRQTDGPPRVPGWRSYTCRPTDTRPTDTPRPTYDRQAGGSICGYRRQTHRKIRRRRGRRNAWFPNRLL